MTARILIIAGSDSGGGAGIQADIKTVTMLGGHAMTSITAITAQNTMRVTSVHPVPTEMVIAQIDAVLSDIGADAIKIGMIGSAETAHAVADRLATVDIPIVFDPVMVATSGSVLADSETIEAFSRLIMLSTVTTPNLPELAALGGECTLTGMTMIKGGHGEGEVIIDRLVGPNGEIARWEGSRIDTTSTHGTGCTLASAVATGLGQGMALEPAIARARKFVRMALLEVPGLGFGHGPMGHQNVREDGAIPGFSLNQITVGTTDYAVSASFYKLLGLKQIVDSPTNGYARFEAPNGVTLSIHRTTRIGDGHVIYFESAALDVWVDRLRAAGMTFEKLPQDESWLWREARLRDPAGNVICLYQAGENRRYPPWRI